MTNETTEAETSMEYFETEETLPPKARRTRIVPVPKALASVLIAFGLLVAADLLVYGHAPGLGLVALFVLVAVAILALKARDLPVVPAAIAGGVFLLALAPLVEQPDMLPFLLALVGLTVLAITAWKRVPARWTGWPLQVARFVAIAPARMLYDGVAMLGRGNGGRWGLRRALVTWIVPAIFGVVFLVLFSDANPILADLFGRLDFSALLDPARVIFWLFAVGFIWPFVVVRLKRWKPRRPVEAAPVAAVTENLLFGRAAILNSLLVFNALFAVQTAMDITYLWVGVALPDGLSYADYAHRGAYPLVATALLAAGFVLAAMRRGGAGEHSKLIRALVYLWIGQNVLLVVSSILRLDLYVSLYSLTELRVAAFIWMGLVAVGLVLILLRIRLNKSNTWLIALNIYALAFTLLVSSITDFSALIADFNVAHSREISLKGIPLDINYFGTLGPTAIPALDRFIEGTSQEHRHQKASALTMRQRLVADFAGRDRDWRAWSFRDWRLEQYLAGVAVSDGTAKN